MRNRGYHILKVVLEHVIIVDHLIHKPVPAVRAQVGHVERAIGIVLFPPDWLKVVVGFRQVVEVGFMIFDVSLWIGVVDTIAGIVFRVWCDGWPDVSDRDGFWLSVSG